MTIASILTSQQLPCNGTATQFSFNNKIFLPTDLVVTLIDTLGNLYPFTNGGSGLVFTNVASGLSYTLFNVDVDTGCYIVFSAPPLNGWTCDMRTDTTDLQSTSIKNQGAFLPELHEEVFDRLTREIQDVERITYTFGIHGPDIEATPWPALPGPIARKGLLLAFDPATGLPTLAAGTNTTVTQGLIGSLLFPQTAAEIAASLTPTNQAYQGLEVIDVLRYGIVPNSVGAATANTTALIALCNPSLPGPTGRLIFPNTTGSDTYYFNNMVQVRDGLRLDLQWCTLNFTKTYASADDCFGFFTFIRDVSIENGTIVCNYGGGGVNNAGPVMRIGGRSGGVAPTYTFDGITPANFYEANFALPMGNIALRNLRITFNNSVAGTGLLMLGGLQNVTCENLYINGSAVGAFGIYYEFGYWSQNGQPATPSLWTSAHARNMVFRNINVTNMNPAGIGADGGGIGLTGAYNCVVEGLFVDTAYNGFEFRPGEALFYRVGPTDTVGAKRGITLRNIVCQNIQSTGIQITGAELALAYLAPVISALPLPQQYAAQTDLMSFSLDGFAVSAGAQGINASGPAIIRNGALTGAATGGQLVLTDECTRFNISNVQILNSSGNGIRANFGSAIWSPPRRKQGSIEACLIAGNMGAGITIANSKSIKVRACRFGYNPLYDVAEEATQTNAISVDATSGGGGVDADGCYVTTSAGAVAYNIIGSTTQLTDGCNISKPKGNVTSVGPWDYDGIGICSQATVGPNAGSKNTYINNNGGLSALAITFTVAPTGSGGTLTAGFSGATGVWPITFSDAEVRYGNFTNGGTSVTWTRALTGAPTTSATVNTCGSNKYPGKLVWDNTNLRLLVATGPQCTDNWERADGGAAVTPS